MSSKRLASFDQPSGRLIRPVQIVETDPFPRGDDRSTCLRKGSIMSQYTIPNLTVAAPNGRYCQLDAVAEPCARIASCEHPHLFPMTKATASHLK
jgi:hypothetical protein